MLKTLAKIAQKFFQKLLFWRPGKEKQAWRRGKDKLTLLKNSLLEYYSSFALTIVQGLVFFTQGTMEEIMLVKPAYREAQARYNKAISQLNELKGSFNKEVRERISRLLKEGAAIIVESSEIGQKQNGSQPQKTQYEFIIGIMAIQKQCMELVEEIEEYRTQKVPLLLPELIPELEK